jgi:predicted acetyltransferase
MEVAVIPAQPEDKPVIDNLLQLYLYDWSEMLGTDVNALGRFDVKWLHKISIYWEEPIRHPFLVKVDGNLAGFALVCESSQLSDDTEITDMREFFIMRKYRRARVGERAATRIFDMFPGKWEVREEARNVPAQHFRRAVIDSYTGGRYEETLVDSDRRRGPVQSFDSSHLPRSPRR